jgi:CO/xanthine dehydrogenase FAD-binding subunit
MGVRAVHLPESAAAAAADLAGGGTVLAGGTVVMGLVNTGSAPSAELVALRRAGLSGIAVAGGTARIGAATTLADLADDPQLAVLHPAIRTIASPTVRNQATVGGNLFVDRPYGDFATCLLALAADCDVLGPSGSRTVPIEELLAGGVAAGELLTAVSVELPDPTSWRYHKAMRRRLNSAAIVTVAAVVETVDGVVSTARIALGAVAPRPVRATSAECTLVGRPLEHDVVEEAGAAARADIAPADDAYASAWYRSRVLPVHLRRALLG